MEYLTFTVFGVTKALSFQHLTVIGTHDRHPYHALYHRPYSNALLAKAQREFGQSDFHAGKGCQKGVQVACLPELFLTNYFCQKIDPSVFDLAEPADGPTTKALAVVAKSTRW